MTIGEGTGAMGGEGHGVRNAGAGGRKRGWIPYVVAAALALAGVAWTLQLWSADLDVPLRYGGDAMLGATAVKGMGETGWIWVNPRLGAPGEMNLKDFPGADTLHYLVLRMLMLPSGSWATALNLFYLLGFPLAAVSCTWAVRRLGMSAPAAVTTGVLYALLPHHFLRGETHLFLSAYYLVPVACLLAIELMGSRPPLLNDDSGREALAPRSRTSLLAIGACVLIGLSGVYYAVFACFFFLVAGALAWWRSRQPVRLAAGAVLAAAVAVTLFAGLAPSIWYARSNGANDSGYLRHSGEAELYPLRMTQLLLPVAGHRLGGFRELRAAYDEGLAKLGIPATNEAHTVSLGIVGSLGLVFLILVLLAGRRPRDGTTPEAGIAADVARLAGFGVLLATSGGLGAVVALGFNQIRAYNRIVVYVAFFALVGSGALLERLVRLAPKESRTRVAAALSAAVLLLGLWDQTTPAMVPAYALEGRDWRTVNDFVGRLESELPEGAAILQLPYVAFPEGPPTGVMAEYDHFKAYLASDDLKWSFGAVKGRPTASMLERLSGRQGAEIVTEARKLGFAGIWVDRAGYKDGGASLLEELLTEVQTEPLISSDNRYVFFRL